VGRKKTGDDSGFVQCFKGHAFDLDNRVKRSGRSKEDGDCR